MQVRESDESDRYWIRRKLIEGWGSEMMVLRGEFFDATIYPALIYVEDEGVLHHRPLTDKVYEIVTLEAYRTGRGVGTALIEAVAKLARGKGYSTLAVVTTNDNLDALRFYQARGFHMYELRPGAVDEARKLKPQIAPTGNYGLPIRDEIELRRAL